MAGRLIDTDPQTAYEHAQAAMRRAGRVDVVREALALTAYATGRFAEALRELRTVRRLSGIDAHRPMEADCERGLGRPERALAIVAETDPATLSHEERVELAIVASGARAELGEHEAGLLVLESGLVDPVTEPELLRRLTLVKAERLEELGRVDEADQAREAAGADEEDEEIIVVDLADDFDEDSDGVWDDDTTVSSRAEVDDVAEADEVADEAEAPEADEVADEPETPLGAETGTGRRSTDPAPTPERGDDE